MSRTTPDYRIAQTRPQRVWLGIDRLRAQLKEQGRKLADTSAADEVQTLCDWLESDVKRVTVSGSTTSRLMLGSAVQAVVERAVMEYVETELEAIEARLKKAR